MWISTFVFVSGPNSPIDWVRQCVELLDPKATVRSKILIGLNFYGFDYTADGGAHVLGNSFIQMLKDASDVKFRLQFAFKCIEKRNLHLNAPLFL